MGVVFLPWCGLSPPNTCVLVDCALITAAALPVDLDSLGVRHGPPTSSLMSAWH